MSTQHKPLEELLRELPPDALAEVREFLESLLIRRDTKKSGPLSQTWAGALSEYRDQYTSLELQQKALEWRGD
jgi:hypothetical protein